MIRETMMSFLTGLMFLPIILGIFALVFWAVGSMEVNLEQELTHIRVDSTESHLEMCELPSTVDYDECVETAHNTEYE